LYVTVGHGHRAFNGGAADRDAADGVQARLVADLLHRRPVGLQVGDRQLNPRPVQGMALRQDARDLGRQVIDLLLNIALSQFFSGLGEVGTDGDDHG